jgi:zinc protease
VRAGLLTAALAERETPQGRAEAAGWALVLRGDARAADRELAELQAVTAADVQRVLRRHLLRPHRVTLVYTQART